MFVTEPMLVITKRTVFTVFMINNYTCTSSKDIIFGYVTFIICTIYMQCMFICKNQQLKLMSQATFNSCSLGTIMDNPCRHVTCPATFKHRQQRKRHEAICAFPPPPRDIRKPIITYHGFNCFICRRIFACRSSFNNHKRKCPAPGL